jgi:hypothetical protein
MVWGQIELQLAIITASVPSLKSLASSVTKDTAQTRESEDIAPRMNLRQFRGNSITPSIQSRVASGKGILVTETVSLVGPAISPTQSAPTRQFTDQRKALRVLGA